MKITKIETLVCHARMRNWVFVKVVTDQPGLIGWGEATLEWHTRSIVGAIEDMSPLLVGEDPTRPEHLWQMMYRQHFWHGHGIVRATAIAGVDLALWDIVGKVANMPLSKLFGGPVRDYVRTYCHLGGGKMEDFYQTPADNAKRFADLALDEALVHLAHDAAMQLLDKHPQAAADHVARWLGGRSEYLKA